jgi:hypothetical protein
MSATPTTRELYIKQISLLLGDQLVDVELDPEHYDAAISLSLDKIKQRSDGALEEQDIFLALERDVEEYTLPNEVQEVRRLYRRGVGAYTNGGINFDPVDAAFYNIYLLQPNKTGGLATWDFYNQFLETTERVFASQYNFVWYNSTKTLRLIRKPMAHEDVIVRCWTTKSEDAVLQDPYTGPWVRSHALALCKHMLGQARSKYPGGFPGPTGTVTLNGEQLMAESAAEVEKLDLELYNLITAGDGYGFIVG